MNIPQIIITPPPDENDEKPKIKPKKYEPDKLKLYPPSRRSSMIQIVNLENGDWLVQPLDLKLLHPEEMPHSVPKLEEKVFNLKLNF